MNSFKAAISAMALTTVGLGTVHAQTQVSLYGQADLFLERANTGNGQHLNRVSSGGSSVSRWGLRGSEDLGGGLKARYRLESGLNLDDGTQQNNAAFSRWVHLGITGPFGAIDAGRMWSPTFVVGLKADVLARNRTSLITNMFKGATDSKGVAAGLPGFLSNSLRYTSPKFAGIHAEAMATFGEATNSSGNGGGFNIQYDKGPLYLGYGFQSLKTGSAATPVAQPDTLQTHMLGAVYKWKPITLYGTANFNRSSAQNSRSSTNYQASVSWNVAGPHTVLAQWARGKTAHSDVSAQGWQLGYDFALSKRTELYARYARVSNRGGSRITLNGAALTGADANPSFVGVGVTHSF